MAFGMNAERREVLRQGVELLTRQPCTWGLRSHPQMNPIKKAHIYLRTEGLHTYTWHKVRRATQAGGVETQQAMSRRVQIECRILSYNPEIEAQEIFATLEARLYRGVLGPNLGGVGLAFTGCTDPQELPAETEDDHAVSVCVATLTFAAADIDSEIDDFDGWIETAEITGTVSGAEAGDIDVVI